MFRRLANWNRHRKRTLDREITIEEAKKIVDGLERVLGIRFTIRGGNYKATIALEGFEPVKELVSWIKTRIGWELPTDMYHYTDVRHQVYSGKDSEQHYLDFHHGHIIESSGGENKKDYPFKKVTVVLSKVSNVLHNIS